MAKERFNRTKPHFNLGIIGGTSQAKTNLTAAISIVYGKKTTDNDQIPGEKGRGIAINNNHIEFETDNRHYAINQSTIISDYVKNMITGAAQMDGAIIIVSATSNPIQQIRESLLLAQQMDLSKIVVFLDDCDKVDDPEILDLVEMEIREQISRYDFDGDNTPIIRGSAHSAVIGEKDWQQKIIELIEACDNYLPLPLRDIDKPFLMAIEDIFTITGRGTVVTGKIERGIIHLADMVECVGIRDTTTYAVTGIEMFRKQIDQAQAGDNVGILLRGADKKDLVRGMVIAAPGSIFAYTDFKADIYMLSKNEGGKNTPITNGYRPQFYFRTTDITGTIQLPANTTIAPGSSGSISVKLIHPIAMEKGQHFAIREGGRTVASGVVTEIINEKSTSFLMTIKSSSTVTGRGVAASGTVERGSVHINDKVKCSGFGKSNEYIVTLITVAGKNLPEAKTGDNAQIVLRGALREDVTPGMVLSATT